MMHFIVIRRSTNAEEYEPEEYRTTSLSEAVEYVEERFNIDTDFRIMTNDGQIAVTARMLRYNWETIHR